jgi:hypothetical protein
VQNGYDEEERCILDGEELEHNTYEPMKNDFFSKCGK